MEWGGTALKPAVEEWILARKPISEKNIASNVLKHGTGGINIGATRIRQDADSQKQNNLGIGVFDNALSDICGSSLDSFSCICALKFSQLLDVLLNISAALHSYNIDYKDLWRGSGDVACSFYKQSLDGYDDYGGQVGRVFSYVRGNQSVLDSLSGYRILYRLYDALPHAVEACGLNAIPSIDDVRECISRFLQDKESSLRCDSTLPLFSVLVYSWLLILLIRHYIQTPRKSQVKNQARFPANLILSHHPDCELVGVKKVKGDSRGGGSNKLWSHYRDGKETVKGARPGGFVDTGAEKGSGKPSGPLHGDAIVEKWKCVDGCPVKELDRQSGHLKSGMMRAGTVRNSLKTRNTYGTYDEHVVANDTHADEGGASRFFYCAKPSTRERNEGLEGLPKQLGGVRSENSGQHISRRKGDDPPPVSNFHPTVKSVGFMKYLCRLITPVGGKVLDPFMGSGSTGIAACLEGFDFIGIEKEKDYFEIAKGRISHWSESVDKGVRIEIEENGNTEVTEVKKPYRQMTILDIMEGG